MKIVAFNGSPSGKNSATNRIVEAFLKGASKAGADVENYQLVDYKLNQCQGCFSCWFKSPGKCIFNDDIDKLMEAYKEADVVCFASPVFTWNVTGLFKNFVDRLIPLKSPIIVENQGNFDMENAEKKSKNLLQFQMLVFLEKIILKLLNLHFLLVTLVLKFIETVVSY